LELHISDPSGHNTRKFLNIVLDHAERQAARSQRHMRQTFLYISLLIVCLCPAWAKPVPAWRSIPGLVNVVTVGPGTVVSIQALDLPFSEKCYVVKYKTDKGRVLEIWHHGELSVMQGMHGILTYSSSPEMILGFRVM
jgi:hypothetical protein